MARANKCKRCNWDGTYTPEEQEMIDNGDLVAKEWVGTNHNLCNVCAYYQRNPQPIYRASEDGEAANEAYRGGSGSGLRFLGAMVALAAVMGGPVGPRSDK